jgi:hypothetical protein
MPTDRLQDSKYFPSGLTAAGMPSIYGGLAGLRGGPGRLGQFEDVPLDWGDSGAFDFGGWGGGGGTADILGVYDVPTYDYDTGFDLGYSPTLEVSPDILGEAYYPAETFTIDVGTAAPTEWGYETRTVDPLTNELSIYDPVTGEGWTYAAPGGASATDPGWTQDASGKQYYAYADGTKVYTDGTQINPNGSYYAADGTFYSPATGTVTGTTGETFSTSKILSGIEAVGQVASKLWGFAKGILGSSSGPTAPAGAKTGQVFRDPQTGSYYQVQPNGTTKMVAPPIAGGVGGIGSGTLLLVGVGAVALLMSRKRKRQAGT